MEIRCIVIDDEPPALQILSAYIKQIPYLKLLKTFDDAITAMEYLQKTKADLVFLDINMPDINGLDLARNLHAPPMIIFTTAYKQFAFEGFELAAVDYLLKPIPFSRFEKAVVKAQAHFLLQQFPPTNEYIFVYSSYQHIKISLNDIVYIESLEDYLKIHLSAQPPVLTLMTLKKMQEKLPQERFKRIHRSYIVAVDKIRAVVSRKVKLLNTTELPVSDSYSEFIRSWKQQ